MSKKLLASLLLALLFVGITSFGMNVPKASAAPVVDGVISPGEYDGGMAIQLIGPYPSGAPFPPQTTNASMYWDSEYLWLAVDEPVPAGSTGTSSWIEFGIDAGPARSVLDGFVLFCSGNLQYCIGQKPSGGWSWAGPVPSGTGGVASYPHTWWAVTASATEFKIKYTDYGIHFGDTIKLFTDRGKEDSSYPPLGDCVIWPQNPTFYPNVDVTTWGDVTLDHAPPPPPPGVHVVDGVISPGEYDTGMPVQLVGRTDPTWKVDAYIDWDTEYLYVAVNESVPPGSGTQSWIEFAMDAGAARSVLDGFVLFCSGDQEHGQCTKPDGTWGWTPYAFLAATGTATEFRIKYTDFGIGVGDTIKLSIDRNQGPPPPDPYGFAAFWPEGAVVYDGHPDPTTWGDVHLVQHDIELTNVVSIKTIIGQGYSSNMTVTVGNPGGYIENFNVTVYANQTMIATPANVTLANGSLATLTLIWNTTGFVKGNYFITAYAGPVPGDVNTTNNAFNDGQVVVTIPGDVNGDFKVSLTDLVTLALAYGLRPGDTRLNPNADIDNNGVVGLSDLVMVANHYGQHYP